MLPVLLCTVCFFDMLIALLVPSTATMIFATDGTAARYAVDFVCLFIGLIALQTYGWKKAPSGWLIAFMLFMVVSHFHAINIHFEGQFIPNDLAIYDYKPLFECTLFFIMFMGIYSMDISHDEIESIKKTLCWIAIIYGAFAILQRFHLDQFYKIMDPDNIVHMSRNPQVGGFICQPVFCAAFLTMLLPFIFEKRIWWQCLIVLAGILATGNRTSLIAGAICLFFMFDFKLISKILFISFITYLVLGTTFVFMNIHIPHFGEERFHIWHDIIADFYHSRCPGINNSHILTGIGIGAFPVIFPFYYSGWYQAHNEYLECLKTLGAIGLWFIMMFISKIPMRDKAIAASLFASFVLAITNATWHIPQLAFLTVFFIGLLFNMEDAHGKGQPNRP